MEPRKGPSQHHSIFQVCCCSCGVPVSSRGKRMNGLSTLSCDLVAMHIMHACNGSVVRTTNSCSNMPRLPAIQPTGQPPTKVRSLVCHVGRMCCATQDRCLLPCSGETHLPPVLAPQTQSKSGARIDTCSHAQQSLGGETSKR